MIWSYKKSAIKSAIKHYVHSLRKKQICFDETYPNAVTSGLLMSSFNRYKRPFILSNCCFGRDGVIVSVIGPGRMEGKKL